MFAEACQKAMKYTRPVAVSTRMHDGTCRTDVGTMIVINSDGWAITAGHLFDSFVKFREDTKKIEEIDKLNTTRVQHPNAPSTQIRVDKDFITNHSFWWGWDGVRLNNVSAKGNYFAMNCSDMEVDKLVLDGDYAFDGVRNAVIRNSRLLTKDAFWNSENVTVYDSFISGEYLGWNSKGLRFVNCTIESLQGLCYIEDLSLVGCKLIDTTLAFEYSSVDAEIKGRAESVFNPLSGKITADEIGELIIEKDKVDPNKTTAECDKIGKVSPRPEWLEGREEDE